MSSRQGRPTVFTPLVTDKFTQISFIHRIVDILSHCLGIGVFGPVILISNPDDETSLARSPALIDSGLSKQSKIISILLHPFTPSNEDQKL